MPTFDGGHYFLTALVPIRTEPIRDGSTFTSPVHALRKQLALMPTAEQTPASRGQSPFARNTRNHFVRFAVIADVAYNGREPQNTIVTSLTRANLTVPQPQDHLTCPFLFFGAEFDAVSGAGSERDAYLAVLWETMEDELKSIFTYCADFDLMVNDAETFSQYIARCQLETTMSFNDYYIDPPNLPVWPIDNFKMPAIGAAVLMATGLVFGWISSEPAGYFLALASAGALAIITWWAYASVMAAGAKPFPSAPDANLPTILKALYLQQAFSRFAIDNQMLAVKAGSARALHAAFGTFLERHQPAKLGVKSDKPDPDDSQTQKPGVIMYRELELGETSYAR